MVQRLRPRASTAVDTDLIPGQGTKLSRMWCTMAKKWKKQKCFKFTHIVFIFGAFISFCRSILLFKLYKFFVYSLRALNTGLFEDILFAIIFSHSVCCLFTSLIMFFIAQKFLILMKFSLSIFLLFHLSLVLYLRICGQTHRFGFADLSL